MGLDLGTKTLGVSISDVTKTIASASTTIFYKDIDDLFLKLDKEVNDNDIEKIVLGFPINMDNTLGDKISEVVNFKRLLEDRYKLEVVLEDERMTTIISNNVLLEADMSRKKRKQVVDKLAATVILQSYLDKNKRGMSENGE
ncbi:MAG: Holliday junction resolvase RuvX [bacterium]|nr:Holliday junction resolvase RuvX [bacterium]